nr:hypothetical protein [Streptomyces sp. SID12488]
MAFAAMELAKLATIQQAQPQQQCQHDHKRDGRSASEWLAIGGAVCVASIGLAFASIALALGGLSIAIVALVLRSMWRDFNKGR